METKLTNGGKSHICGEPAIHNGTKNKMRICIKCGMAVDIDGVDWKEDFNKEFVKREGEYNLPYINQHGILNPDRIIAFISSTILSEKEKLLKEILALGKNLNANNPSATERCNAIDYEDVEAYAKEQGITLK